MAAEDPDLKAKKNRLREALAVGLFIAVTYVLISWRVLPQDEKRPMFKFIVPKAAQKIRHNFQDVIRDFR